MIFGSGIDIVEIYRIRDAIDKWGNSFLTKIFTQSEINYASSRRFSSQHYAARFAAKEAVIKAFGQPKKHPIRLTDIEILNDDEGKPIIGFHGDALKLKKKKKINSVMVSMAHSKDYAVANVILLNKGAK